MQILALTDRSFPLTMVQRKSFEPVSHTMDGKSSWISDMVWMNSIAHAEGRACSILPPTSSHAAKQRAGLTLFPPAKSEYLRVSQTVGQLCKCAWHTRSNNYSAACHCLAAPAGSICKARHVRCTPPPSPSGSTVDFTHRASCSSLERGYTSWLL